MAGSLLVRTPRAGRGGLASSARATVAFLLSMMMSMLFMVSMTRPALAQTTEVFSKSDVLVPGNFTVIDSAEFQDKLPTTVAAGSILNITVTGKMCGVEAYSQTVDPDACVFEDSEGFQAGISLYCGSGSGDVSVSDDFVTSQYVGGTQTIVLGQEGGLYTTDGNGSLTCVVAVHGYNEGPVWYEFGVGISAGVGLVGVQGGAMGRVYEACCADGCRGWESTERRRVSRALLQDTPAPEEAVPNAPAPGPAVAPAPSEEAAAPAPEAVPTSTNTSTATYDFCQFSGSECNLNGYLTTLDLSGMNLTCDIAELADILKGIPTLQKLSLSNNAGLTGSLDAALGVFAEIKSSTNTTLDLTQYPWTDILVSETGVNGTLGGSPSLDVTPPICAEGLGSLSQLAFEGTGVAGSLDPCMFDSESSKLQVLLGSGSKITNLTNTFGEAPMMRSLEMANASLEGTVGALPPFLGEFQVSNNGLNGTLPTFGEYVVLFDASGNNLSGEVPSSFVDHPRLRSVDLERNQLSSLPSDWVGAANETVNETVPVNAPPLQLLSVSMNPLGQNFPAGLELYGNLTYLKMSDTQSIGDLPELRSGAFPSLTHLFVDQNSLTGTVPDSWQNITLFLRTASVERVGNFSFNAMSGELPSWLSGNPPSGAVYDFAGNDFDNGCLATYSALNTCAGAYEPTPGPTPAPAPAAPAPEDSGKETAGAEDGEISGSSVAFAVFVTIVSLVILGIGGYFFYKWYKGRQNQGSFQRYMDSGSSMVQMVSNQTYNPYNPTLANV